MFCFKEHVIPVCQIRLDILAVNLDFCLLGVSFASVHVFNERERERERERVCTHALASILGRFAYKFGICENVFG